MCSDQISALFEILDLNGIVRQGIAKPFRKIVDVKYPKKEPMQTYALSLFVKTPEGKIVEVQFEALQFQYREVE